MELGDVTLRAGHGQSPETRCPHKTVRTQIRRSSVLSLSDDRASGSDDTYEAAGDGRPVQMVREGDHWPSTDLVWHVSFTHTDLHM